ncbi:hypothetical protein [Acinetobacter populi]|uniref:Uncharacterized protein n=1 Tax=Acinetobacter populi TaxID=1582270 RepID=A0A1Z9Z3X0_9GAMM|nr:hypothetical protein [Acinetobacter populi]OUY09171.1 hypothetical protein CAP51_06140 [Acinetobacter populi]
MGVKSGFQNATHFADFTPKAVPAAEGFQVALPLADFPPLTRLKCCVKPRKNIDGSERSKDNPALKYNVF